MSRDLRSLIRAVPDFPRPGILFRDITTLLRDGAAFGEALHRMAEPWQEERVDLVAGIESRGFLVGTPLAIRMEAGFVPLRKPGRLPAETVSRRYALEYGEDAIEMHRDAVHPGARVLLVDDLLATGGTAAAAVELLREAGAEMVGVAFLVELTDLRGRERLPGVPVHSLVTYEDGGP